MSANRRGRSSTHGSSAAGLLPVAARADHIRTHSDSLSQSRTFDRLRRIESSVKKCLILSQDFSSRYQRIVWVDADILTFGTSDVRARPAREAMAFSDGAPARHGARSRADRCIVEQVIWPQLGVSPKRRGLLGWLAPLLPASLRRRASLLLERWRKVAARTAAQTDIHRTDPAAGTPRIKNVLEISRSSALCRKTWQGDLHE